MKPVLTSNGSEAIRQLEEASATDSPFSLAVVDAQMPEGQRLRRG
jgi:hypothetical protein